MNKWYLLQWDFATKPPSLPLPLSGASGLSGIQFLIKTFSKVLTKASSTYLLMATFFSLELLKPYLFLLLHLIASHPRSFIGSLLPPIRLHYSFFCPFKESIQVEFLHKILIIRLHYSFFAYTLKFEQATPYVHTVSRNTSLILFI